MDGGIDKWTFSRKRADSTFNENETHTSQTPGSSIRHGNDLKLNHQKTRSEVVKCKRWIRCLNIDSIQLRTATDSFSERSQKV